jgi:CRISPR/Cas system CMR-associated protein Cmr5 small subunit
LISRCGTSATIALYLLELGKEITDARKKSQNDTKATLSILHQRRWFIVSKLLEFPVSVAVI